MATITATPRPRPDTPQRVVPPRTTPELLTTIKIELIYTFISEIPITDQKPNSMDQVSAGMEEWDMANHTWRYCYQCDFYALSGFHLIYTWKWESGTQGGPKTKTVSVRKPTKGAADAAIVEEV